ncbi:hypothetical protein GCM10029978_098940 [Actinoallomurus acanthiterrae]
MESLRSGDPRVVGPYRLEGRLGGGGMGQVFLGRSRGGRPVAVKLVRPELAEDAGFRRRFALEVEAARRVGGFYTAQVVDADTDADPPWLVTAYIPGPSLQEAVDQHGPLPQAAISVLGQGLAEGLTAIHACGLVHRDLKPSNVVLADDGPRVIDFGIARALDATSQTASRTVIGTPSYMSPEQARGHAVGPPSDVFSLGAALAFAATGQSPFGIGSVQAVIYRVVHDDPDLTGLPAPLADLLTACLAKDPADRPAVSDILDRFATPTETATRWLPPGMTTMITERAAAVGTLTAVPPETKPATLRKAPSPPAADASPDQANLMVGNLSQGELDVILDDTILDTVHASGSSTFHLAPGVHSVQVKTGPQRSALRRIEATPGATIRIAYDVPHPGAGPASVDTAAFTAKRTSLAIRFLVSTALVGAVCSAVLLLVAPSGVGVMMPPVFLGLVVLVTLWGLASSPRRLTLRPNGFTYDPDRWDADLGSAKISIDWDTLEQVSVIGDGPDAKLVVWFREKHRPATGTGFQGTVVCKARTLTGRQGHAQIRAALRWFAGDIYVEQPT